MIFKLLSPKEFAKNGGFYTTAAKLSKNCIITFVFKKNTVFIFVFCKYFDSIK
jgi:hypothetical protein